MITNIVLLHYNNYANRIIVKEDSLADYLDKDSNAVTCQAVNFVPGDGVNTTLVLGKGSNPSDLFTGEKDNFDYLLVVNQEDENSTVSSRWFIINRDRTREGQYRLDLRRDVVADNLSEVQDATCFIKKGMIKDVNDSGIYNKEEITTNQIKSDEFLLKDETQCGWVVGYVAKDRDDGAGQLTPVTFTEQTIPGVEASDDMASESYASEEEFYAAHPELVGDLATLNSWAASLKLDIKYAKWFSTFWVGQTITVYNNGQVSCKESGYQNKTGLYQNTDGLADGWKGWFFDIRGQLAEQVAASYRTATFKQAMLDQIAAKEGVTFAPESQMQAFFNFVKREPVIKIGTKFYKPYDKYGVEGAKSTNVDSHNISVGSSAFDLFNNINRSPRDSVGYTYTISGNAIADTYKLEWSYNRHALGLREVFTTCKAKIPANVPVLKDAPYHMFAIPYSDDLALYEGNTLKCVTNKSVAMNAAQALAQQAGAGVVYDVQLLPYCPVRDIIKTEKITAHASVGAPTTDIYFAKTGTGILEHLIKIPVAKLNHQYVISKDVTLDTTKRCLGIRPHFRLTQGGAIPEGVLKVLIGENLEQPTDYYDAYGIELRLTDIEDLTSTPIINIYKSAASMNNHTPDVVIDYATYAAANYYIGIEATDNCDYESAWVLVTPGGPTTYITEWVYLPSGGVSGITRVRGALMTIKAWLNDYIYYEDYYLTKVDVTNAITSDIVTMLEGQESDLVSMIFWCTDSQFSFNKFLDNYFLLNGEGGYTQDEITDLINNKVKEGNSIREIKVRNQTDMLRLASPNYSNFFDINIQRNKGIEYINVDCTYKPYQPYIHLNPNFKGLYGADYNDIRGLICGGDYSIATTSDAWATYQLQNKNYQAVFDRQIQQLETTQSIQRQSDIANAITGVGTGAVGGALVGAKIGGGAGAVGGAVVGAVASAIGGTIDVYNNQRIRELQLSTMKDIHGYQLDNIKALPLGLSKTSYLTNNNKLFPFLEFYTCTPVEEQAVRDLLDYNGMTINRIGKISDFQSDEELPYIKAQLIRINVKDDAHIVQTISDELATGLYIPEGEDD